MGQYQFVTDSTLDGAASGAALTGISDLEIGVFGGQTVLYSLTRAGGALTVYDISSGVQIDQVWLTDGSYSNIGNPEIAFVDSGGAPRAVAVGYGTPDLYSHATDGSQSTWETATVPQLDMSLVNNLVNVTVGSNTFTFGSLRIGGLVDVGGLSSGSVTVDNVPLPNDMNIRFDDMVAYTANGRGFLIAALGSEDKVAVFEVLGDGSVAFASSIGTHTGLGINAPSELATYTLGGEHFVVIGSPLSGSLTLAQISNDGVAQALDQINDDLSTRFDTVSALEAVVVDGRAFVVAGGSDDGLTLLTVLPDGRLHVLGVIADTAGTTLQNVSAIALHHEGDTLRIFAAAEGEAGLTEFKVDMADIGTTLVADGAGGILNGTGLDDFLFGGDGNDTLYGQGGEDIIADGAGLDSLFGGSGRDIFIMSQDGQDDTIEDFNYLEDQIDLSSFGLHDTGDTLIVTRSYGADIVFADETIAVHTHNGASLLADTLRAALIVPDHVSVDGTAQLHAGPMGGSIFADVLYGSDFGDVIDAGAAADVVDGRGGNDTIFGRDGEDILKGEAGDDTLYGGEDNDKLYGGRGFDTLSGEAGDDFLAGGERRGPFDDAADDVYRLYRAVFGRDPESAGHQYWTDAMVAGTQTLSSVAAFFLTSNEFNATFGNTDNAEFVTLLYQNVLERDPDASGLTYWTNSLDAGMSRQTVVLGFSESPEFQIETAADAANFTYAARDADHLGEVYRLYVGLLGREPLHSGLSYWMSALSDGTTYDAAISQFITSEEFTTNFATDTPEAYVQTLYTNILGRAPSQGEETYWVGQLNSGAMTNAELAKFFIGSQEFRALTQGPEFDFVLSIGVEDTLIGGGGNDILLGGALTDRFVFETGATGTTRVADLEPWDRIDVTDFGFTSSTEALSHFAQVEDDVLFTHDTTSVIFINTDLTTITGDMFDF